MELTFECPQCGTSGSVSEVERGGSAACGCGWSRPLRETIDREGVLSACPFCATDELYVQKDFPHGLGLLIVIVGFGVSTVFWYYYLPALAPWVAPFDPAEQFFDGLTLEGAPLPPSAKFWLGTDTLGRDLLSRMIYGARNSLIIGLLANGAAVLIGTTLGVVAGYLGGTPFFGRDINGDGDILDTVTVLAPSQTRTFRPGVIANLRWTINPDHLFRVSYTLDWAFHRQTGEVGLLESDGEPEDVFPRNDPQKDVFGVVLQKRDRKSQAILNRLAFADKRCDRIYDRDDRDEKQQQKCNPHSVIGEKVGHTT